MVHDGDIFILDRGYRDAQPLFRELGIEYKIPVFLGRNQKQLFTEEANDSRLVTKTRWIVEARNGAYQVYILYFFDHVVIILIFIILVNSIIAGALINRYHPLILMEGVNAELARELLDKSREVNIVQARVEAERMCFRNAQWVHLHEGQLRDFPRLALECLQDLIVYFRFA